jgi:hypothetical protein
MKDHENESPIDIEEYREYLEEMDRAHAEVRYCEPGEDLLADPVREASVGWPVEAVDQPEFPCILPTRRPAPRGHRSRRSTGRGGRITERGS